MAKKDTAPRKRMVVEELHETKPETPQEPVEELKEKVGELQGITEHISDDAEKSVGVQEQIVEAAEKVVPPTPITPPPTVIENTPYNTNSGPNPMMIIIPGILLLGALLGGILFYQKRLTVNETETPVATEASVVSIETTPTSTPSAAPDLTKYKISILNGGGIPREAGKAKTLLEAAGFTVSSTANAKDYSFTKTVVAAKLTVDKAFLDALSAALGKTYAIGTSEELPSTSTDSVVVTIGSSKK